MTPGRAVHSIVVALTLVAVGSAWSDAHAQAWVGGKGSLDLGLDYNLAVSDKVVSDGDMDFEDAGTTTHQITVSAEYVPIAKLAVNVALPLAFLKYTGNQTNFVHGGGGTYDDGKTHTTLTDLRAGVRYQVLAEPVAISPHLAVTIPVADYETVGNTVAGRHLKALHLGLGIGRVFGAATYVHALYEFSLVEKYDRTAVTKEVGQNRSDIALTIGHKLLDQRLDLHVDANFRIAHGGINFSQFDELPPLPDDQLLYHDPLLAENIVLVGGGIGYELTNTLGVTLAGRLFVNGSNTQNASVLALGFSWSPL